MGVTISHLKVSALHRLASDVKAFAPTHVISLLDPDIARDRVPEFPRSDVLQVCFFDGDDVLCGPDNETVRRILQFLEDFDCSELVNGGAGRRRLLIHCHAGASRSTAVAYVALCMALGVHREQLAYDHLLRITNKPWPNRRVVVLADQQLRRNGRMVAWIDHYRSLHPKRIEAYRRLNRRRQIS